MSEEIDIARQWVAKARNDLLNADNNLRSEQVPLDQQKIFFNICQWKTVQSRSGHHVVNRALIIYYHSPSSWHRRILYS